MKKIYFIVIFILFLILIEFLSSIIHQRLAASKNQYNEFKKTLGQSKDLILKEDYSDLIPYVRHKEIYTEEEYGYIKIKDDNELFYNTITRFDKSKKNNILFQGDSWAEKINHKKIYNYLLSYSEKNNLGMVNAGISSFSLTPMTSQLYILRNQFEIYPSIIVAIIDQSDIGDDLFRYTPLDPTSPIPVFKKEISMLDNKITKNLNSQKMSSIVLLEVFRDYFLLEKNRYDLNNIDTAKRLFKRVYYKIKKIPTTLSPLLYGINDYEKRIFLNNLNYYLDIAFQDQNIKKVVFVTHPHKNHVVKSSKNKYKFDVADLVNEAIQFSKFKNKITHIEFRKIYNFDTKVKNIYQDGDIFSHLKFDSYLNYYYPDILKVVN